MRPGDVLLVAGTSLGDRAIRCAQARRPSLRAQARWSHTALVVSEQGDIIEAVRSGVRRNMVSAYSDVETRIVPVTASDEDRAEMVRYANSVVGREYGLLDILSIGLALGTGGTVNITSDSALICSQLCAEALCRAGYLLPHDSSAMCPASVALLLSAPIASSRVR